MSFWKGSERRHHFSQKPEFFLFLFYLASPFGFTEVIAASLLFGIVCHSYKETILGFIWSLFCGCLWYNWVKFDTIVRWNEKIAPSIEPTNMTGFSWVRGVTCCLNFHASLISSVSQWTWHLMPFKNGIMNLFLSVSLRVSPCVGYVYVQYVHSVFCTTRKNPLFSCYRGVQNGTLSS